MMRFVLFLAVLLAFDSAVASAAKVEPIEKSHAQDLQMVRDKTKDPNSVQFRALRIGSTGALCGEMNAKNSYGGYVGFKSFFVRDGQALIVTDEGRSERKDLSDTQWAWERQLDQKEFDEACGAK